MPVLGLHRGMSHAPCASSATLPYPEKMRLTDFKLAQNRELAPLVKLKDPTKFHNRTEFTSPPPYVICCFARAQLLNSLLKASQAWPGGGGLRVLLYLRDPCG